MADNLSGLNVATRVGEGNANIMSWGNLDRAANQLYQEQKQREARGYNDYLQGQAALQKEFANVRSADVPDVVNDYNTLKKIKQSILFDEKIKSNPTLLAQKQQEANIADAQLRQRIAASQQLKESDKMLVTDMFHNSDKYDYEKRKEHSVDMNLPLSERIKLGRLDGTPYLYQGGDATKLMPLVKQAMGTQKAIPIGEEVVADDGYKIEQKHINRGNNPVQYASTMYKGMQTNKLGQYASAELSKMTPQQIATITSKFNNIPDTEFEQKWGVKKEDLVNGVLPDDKTGQYVLLDAMQYAINNMPKEAESKFRPNEAFKTAQNIKEWNRRNNITSAQKNERASMVSNMGYNPRQHVEEIYNNGSDDNHVYPIKKGIEVKGREISMPDVLQDKYYDKVDGRVRRPDRVIMDDDKKNIHLIFFNGTEPNGQPRVDQKKSRSIPVTTDIIPDLEKSFGNPKKNLSFGNQAVSSPSTNAPKKPSGIVWKN